MKERPILFSAPMVRALLAGRKTQTRRAVKGRMLGVVEERMAGVPFEAVVCPYGMPGDRLWVKERCYEGTHSGGRPWVRYFADGADQVPEGTRWRPAIHMHRWASRIDLELTDLRVQRLHDITESDAEAEGVVPPLGYYSARDAYRLLWGEINGPGSWAANPWVWVLAFGRVRP